MIRIVTTKLRAKRCTLELSDAFADVAEALAPAFDLIDDADDHSDEPIGELVWLRPRLVSVPNRVRVAGDVPTPPWGGDVA